MKAYQQVITELLPEPYASLAIERCDYPDREYQHEIKSVLSFAFVWFDTPEGLDFWSKVDEHLRTGTPLPPDPLESRILNLESRIAALESAAGGPTLPPLPEGCARWVYRGNAWVSPGRVHWTARNFHYGDPCGCASFGQTNGLGILEYWEAVRKHPRYRLLVSGEVIWDGDEALDTHAVGVGTLDVWVPSTSVGREYIPAVNTIIRRAISNYTDAP
jgi:hypothetical protein